MFDITQIASALADVGDVLPAAFLGVRIGLDIHGQSAGGSALDLIFDGRPLDPRITFTRAAGPATFVGSDGLIQSAGTNVARQDYDPVTLAWRGLLVEQARTNSILRSEEFDNASWT